MIRTPVLRSLIGTILKSSSLDIREAVAGQNRLCNNSTDSKHSQSSVLQLLVLHVLHLLLTLSFHEPKRVQSKVARLAARSLQHLRKSDVRHQFESGGAKSNESHGSLIYEGVVGCGGGEIRGVGKKRDFETEVRCDETNKGYHSKTGMLQFGLTEVVHWKVVRDAKRVEANIIAYVSLQVLWVGKEGESRACDWSKQ